MIKITLNSFFVLLAVLWVCAYNTEENVMAKTEIENSNFEKIRIEDNIVSFKSMEHFSGFLKKSKSKEWFLSEFKE